MGKVVYIWQSEPSEFTEFLPSGIYQTRPIPYIKKVNAALKQKGINEEIELDNTKNNIEELISRNYSHYIFAPGLWHPQLKEALEKNNLKYLELLSVDLYDSSFSKIIDFLK
ncbi:hypothetical protein [Companilactobacillus sp. DQM5]|uniref:hypothetical protein n=1 Tax=Companilactobacillus sp. DQM5 TaxID=3463359 RepID=UPI004059F3AE